MNYKALAKYFLIFSIAIFLCACGKNVEFSEKGEIAVSKVKTLQSYMKAPDTFILRDDVLVMEVDEGKFVFISYSAENNFGVPLQDMSVFYNDEYYGSYYDMKENQQILRTDYVTDEKYEEAMERRMMELRCLINFSQWKIGKIDDFEVVSCKEIAEKLGIKYETDTD